MNIESDLARFKWERRAQEEEAGERDRVRIEKGEVSITVRYCKEK
jgi:hypothetical protein